jgi:hypothetical protein
MFKYVQHKTEARWRSQFCKGKAIIITHFNCVYLALDIQHEMRMRLVILSPVVCPTLTNFPHYLINGTIFRKKIYCI